MALQVQIQRTYGGPFKTVARGLTREEADAKEESLRLEYLRGEIAVIWVFNDPEGEGEGDR